MKWRGPEPGAVATDVEQLIERIRTTVAQKYSIDLDLEIRVW